MKILIKGILLSALTVTGLGSCSHSKDCPAYKSKKATLASPAKLRKKKNHQRGLWDNKIKKKIG